MRIHIASLVLAFASACASESGGSTAGELQTSPDPTATYRAVVSLGSIGSGIDAEAQADILALVNTYDIDLTPDLHEWGLEGERNLCFALTGLNAGAQGLFIDDLRAIVATGDVVFLYENARCDTLGE